MKQIIKKAILVTVLCGSYILGSEKEKKDILDGLKEEEKRIKLLHSEIQKDLNFLNFFFSQFDPKLGSLIKGIQDTAIQVSKDPNDNNLANMQNEKEKITQFLNSINNKDKN